MKGVRFYLEYPSNRAKRQGTRKSVGNHSGTVVAVYVDLWRIGPYGSCIFDAIVCLRDAPNSVVCSGAVSEHYLNRFCKVIGESLARRIHPNLFIQLDQQ